MARKANAAAGEGRPALFTKEMKQTHTILIPDMMPIHFQLICAVWAGYGYRTEVLTDHSPAVVQTGLKYVHNDMCYPALLVTGQMIRALQSGEYDLSRTALIMAQTGGGCRASNYIHLIRKALHRAELSHIPVLSLNINRLERHPGFRLTLGMAQRLIVAAQLGDLLMLLRNQVRPYEAAPGAADALLAQWIARLSAQMAARSFGYSVRALRPLMREIAAEFAALPVRDITRVRVGIVGEIYMKYAGLGNNNLEDFLLEQGCEYKIPGVMGFIMYCVSNQLDGFRLYGGRAVVNRVIQAVMGYLQKLERAMIDAVAATRLQAPHPFAHTRTMADGVVGHGACMGEGWLLTAEMLELAREGYPNVICVQPFGCLPNHINGRGMMNAVKAAEPSANIVAIDYDPGAARVNQENRIKLMLAHAADKPQPVHAPAVPDTANCAAPDTEPAREKQAVG